jgi:hypothetical protein
LLLLKRATFRAKVFVMSARYGYGLDSDVDSDVQSDSSGDSDCGIDFFDYDSDSTENRAKKPRLGAYSETAAVSTEAESELSTEAESELSITFLLIIWVLFFSPLPLNIFGISPALIIFALSEGVGSGNYLRLGHTTRSRVEDVNFRAHRMLNWHVLLANSLKCSQTCLTSMVTQLTPFMGLPRIYSKGFLNPDNILSSFERKTVHQFCQLYAQDHGGRNQESIGGRPRAINATGEIITGMQRLAHAAPFAMQLEASDLSMGTLCHQMEHFSWAVYQALGDYLQLPDAAKRRAIWARVPACIRAHFPGATIYAAVDGTLQTFGEHCKKYPDLYGAYWNGRKGSNHGYKFNQQLAFSLFGEIIFASFGGVGGKGQPYTYNPIPNTTVTLINCNLLNISHFSHDHYYRVARFSRPLL